MAKESIYKYLARISLEASGSLAPQVQGGEAVSQALEQTAQTISGPVVRKGMNAGGVEITAVPVTHSKSHLFPMVESRANAYLIRKHGSPGTVFFCGDAAYGAQFREIGNLGQIDLALLPIGGYEPRWFMGPIHINPQELVRAVAILKARHNLAMHWGTFALGSDEQDQPPKDLKAALKKAGMNEKRIWVTANGGTFKVE